MPGYDSVRNVELKAEQFWAQNGSEGVEKAVVEPVDACWIAVIGEAEGDPDTEHWPSSLFLPPLQPGDDLLEGIVHISITRHTIHPRVRGAE
jgi:hypothetical protein